jgi:aminoglycoside 6'-N-acetyltransferase I
LIVEDTVVDPRMRGEGVGSLLVKELEEKAKAAGIVSIDLLTLHGCPAQRFWEKHGYEKSGYEQHRKEL